MKTPSTWINPLLFQIFLPSLRALISGSPFDYCPTPTFSPSRATKGPLPKVTSSISNFSQRGARFCSCIPSPQEDPGKPRPGAWATGPQEQLIRWDFPLEKLKTSKTEITPSTGLSILLHSLEVRSLVTIYVVRQRD